MKLSRPRVAFCALVLALAALAPALAAEGVVNINDADLEQLTLLPRIGEFLAGRILEFREENGGFKSVEELLLVKGIGDKTFELLEPHVAISGETTLTEKVSVEPSGDEE
ncbi:MAG: helix-hairpin-helix domain-containing protein [Acidobacteriota bacterium]|nr:helix-hairpin-helix domain-containing protein [Acidobacteriota bacterium]MDH3525039.1 helix-hairpin-helix domain-containing protein [Acidobacteriota bacterium]